MEYCGIEGCPNQRYCRSVCRRHYRDLPKRAGTWGRQPRSLRARLLQAIEIDAETGCWLWQRKIDRDGYGKRAKPALIAWHTSSSLGRFPKARRSTTYEREAAGTATASTQST